LVEIRQSYEENNFDCFLIHGVHPRPCWNVLISWPWSTTCFA